MQIKSVKKITNKSKRYDIEVDVNHNFFANNILVHNCSATYFIKKMNFFRTIFGVCSRTVYKKTKDNSYYWQIAIKEDIEKKLKIARKDLNIDICIQGEIIGPKIQKNKYKLTELQLYVYNVFNIKTQKYFTYYDILEFCKNYNFKMVPIVTPHFNPKDCYLNNMCVNSIVELSKGKSAINPKTTREGIVVRAIDGQKKLSFKVINPDFLLEHGE
jgi:hypothetical protein